MSFLNSTLGVSPRTLMRTRWLGKHDLEHELQITPASISPFPLTYPNWDFILDRRITPCIFCPLFFVHRFDKNIFNSKKRIYIRILHHLQYTHFLYSHYLPAGTELPSLSTAALLCLPPSDKSPNITLDSETQCSHRYVISSQLSHRLRRHTRNM